ncbi:hypothetical protein J6P92_03965 [bacterium]|nr:hypothetical protein [bacterium]
MNNNNSEKYKEDFERALNIYENNYSHEDLINFLKNGSIVEKQTAVLKLNEIKTLEEARILMNNLTGCDGKIREAVSFRLKEFTAQKPEFFLEFCDIFLDAIIDINGNICRNTIFALKYLKPFESFREEFCSKLCYLTLELAKKAKNFDIQEGKYKVNKEIFKLYWYLETLSEFVDSAENLKVGRSGLLSRQHNLEEILQEAKQVKDYTIREKVAKILSKTDNFSDLKEELKNDENYYVRRY